MTRDELDAIRGRSNEANEKSKLAQEYWGHYEHYQGAYDMLALLAEVERLTIECDAAVEDFDGVMTSMAPLEQGSDYAQLKKEPCHTCASGPNRNKCAYPCGRIDYRSWKWRGAKEANNDAV
ncbi:MAG: hypothetical protein FWE09_00245 [Treponema sp.]|nr:hypothetical protein [Treponema sp.]